MLARQDSNTPREVLIALGYQVIQKMIADKIITKDDLTPHNAPLLTHNPYLRYFIKEKLLEIAELNYIPQSSSLNSLPDSISEDESHQYIQLNRNDVRAVLENFIEFAKLDLADEHDVRFIYEDLLPELCAEKFLGMNIFDNKTLKPRIKTTITLRLRKLLDEKIEGKKFYYGPRRLVDTSLDTINKLMASCRYLNIDFKGILNEELVYYLHWARKGYKEEKQRLDQIKIRHAELELNPFVLEEISFAQRLFNLSQRRVFDHDTISHLSEEEDPIEKIEMDLRKAAEEYKLPFEVLLGAAIHRLLLFILNDIENNSMEKYVEAYPVFKLMMSEIKLAEQTAREAKEEVAPLSHWNEALSKVITIAENESASPLSPPPNSFLDDLSKRPTVLSLLFALPKPSSNKIVKQFCVGLCQLKQVLQFEKDWDKKTGLSPC